MFSWYGNMIEGRMSKTLCDDVHNTLNNANKWGNLSIPLTVLTFLSQPWTTNRIATWTTYKQFSSIFIPFSSYLHLTTARVSAPSSWESCKSQKIRKSFNLGRFGSPALLPARKVVTSTQSSWKSMGRAVILWQFCQFSCFLTGCLCIFNPK